MIPYGRQRISQADIDAVVDVLRSDFLTQGPRVPEFESAVTDKVGARHGVAVNSATSALHIACIALGLGPGDILWTSPITFVASANCAVYCGANIDFVDIRPGSFNMCPDHLAEKLEQAARNGTLPKVIVPVHMCGQSCEMKQIGALAQRYGVKVIEDASHAIGGSFRGAPVGKCEYSDITVFSFHPVKIITTAEGGMAVTNSEELANEMRLLRSHGITRNEAEMTSASEGAWYYQQIALGWNYRMTDIQAALGLSQLDELTHFVERRNEIASRYDELLKSLPALLPDRVPETYSTFHLYVIRLEDGFDRAKIFDFLRGNGVGVNVHYIPVHLQPFYQQRGFRRGDFPIAEDYYFRALSLPVFPDLTDRQQDKVVAELGKALAA